MHVAVCTCRFLVNLQLVKNWRIFGRQKNSCQWNIFMISSKSLFASRDVSIYFGKETCGHLRCWFYLYTEFTRLLNVECFKSAVSAIFLSNAPTFFFEVFFVVHFIYRSSVDSHLRSVCGICSWHLPNVIRDFVIFLLFKYRTIQFNCPLLNLIHILLCKEFYIIGLDIRQCLCKSSPKDQGYKYKHIILIWLINNGNIGCLLRQATCF